MQITVNGEPHDLPDSATLADLIDRLGLGASAVAAEVNGTVVRKRDHAEHALSDGDTIELVTLVGGG